MFYDWGDVLSVTLIAVMIFVAGCTAGVMVQGAYTPECPEPEPAVQLVPVPIPVPQRQVVDTMRVATNDLGECRTQGSALLCENGWAPNFERR